jgi:hypothetical protein
MHLNSFVNKFSVMCACNLIGKMIHELSVKHILQGCKGFSTVYVCILILIFPKNKQKNIIIGFHSEEFPMH